MPSECIVVKMLGTLMRTYSELVELPTFLDRFEYLKLSGKVGSETFGFDRHLNQDFYKSKEWRDIRHHVIARDLGQDLAMDGHEILDRILIHHMNPMSPLDIIHGRSIIADPENLITTTHQTHNAIHYGDSSLLSFELIERRPGDTKLW